MSLPSVALNLDELRAVFGFGVAGNVAGHLEQAGEAGDFAEVVAAPEAPKGIFPWYVPGGDTFLGTFPLGFDRIVRPALAGGAHLQIEPEVGVLFDVTYAGDGTVAALAPRAFGAFNDCSVRRPGAAKISEKKNWGPASKGVAPTFFAVDDLAPDGPTAAFRLACFLRRDGVVSPYGVDSPLAGYSYYGAQLQDWIVDRLAHQTGGDGTPLEDVGALLVSAVRPPRPARVLVGIGATRYTPFGETTFLDAGDEAVVVVYDGARHTPADVEAAATAGHLDDLVASVLRQTVTDAG